MLDKGLGFLDQQFVQMQTTRLNCIILHIRCTGSADGFREEQELEVHALHLRAFPTGVIIALYDLRIALKRFRYTLENFLLRLHENLA